MKSSAKKAWSKEEEEGVLAALRKRESFDRIAQRHERSANAIKLRFGMLCRKELESTPKSVGDLSLEYHLPEDHILRCMDDLENIQKKQQPNADRMPMLPLFDPADISILKEEVLVMNEKLDKIYRYVKKLMEMSKNHKTVKKTKF